MWTFGGRLSDSHTIFSRIFIKLIHSWLLAFLAWLLSIQKYIENCKFLYHIIMKLRFPQAPCTMQKQSVMSIIFLFWSINEDYSERNVTIFVRFCHTKSRLIKFQEIYFPMWNICNPSFLMGSKFKVYAFRAINFDSSDISTSGFLLEKSHNMNFPMM